MMIHEPLQRLLECIRLSINKGDFPVNFNRTKNYDHVRALSAFKYYDYARKYKKEQNFGL